MSVGRAIEHVDVELIRAAKTGDMKAFEEMFNRYQKRVYNMVYGMVRNENDAAELTQDVFVRVFDGIRLLRAEEAFLTWLRALTINICRDHARKRPPAPVMSLDAKSEYDDDVPAREIADESAGPAQALESKDTRQAVHRAIESLPDERHEVVMLHHIEGMDVEEIAKALRCPVGTVKSRLARAREELRRKLAPYVEY